MVLREHLAMITDTIPGRQCMAACFFLLKQFEDVLIYLNSVKVNMPSSLRCWSLYQHLICIPTVSIYRHYLFIPILPHTIIIHLLVTVDTISVSGKVKCEKYYWMLDACTNWQSNILDLEVLLKTWLHVLLGNLIS